MKKLLVLLAAFGLAACTTNAPKQEPAPPAPPPPAAAPAPKPVSNLFAPWYRLRERDVNDARAFDGMVRKIGKVPVESVIGKVAQTTDDGRTLVVDIWKGTNMGVPPPLLKKRDRSLQQAVELAGEFAIARSSQARILIGVFEKDKATVRKWLDRGIARGRGEFPTEIQWKTMKRGDLPFIRIEPADPQYSFGPLTR